MRTKKQYLLFILVCAVIGALQMWWFLPDGLSCKNARDGLIDSVIDFMVFQSLFLLLVMWQVKNKWHLIALPVLLGSFWFLINWHEFLYRHACWSTYSKEAVFSGAIFFSRYSIPICLTAILLTYVLLNRYFDKRNKL